MEVTGPSAKAAPVVVISRLHSSTLCRSFECNGLCGKCRLTLSSHWIRGLVLRRGGWHPLWRSGSAENDDLTLGEFVAMDDKFRVRTGAKFVEIHPLPLAFLVHAMRVHVTDQPVQAVR